MKAASLLALAAFIPAAWMLARRAARRRGIVLGPFPFFFLASIAGATSIAGVFGRLEMHSVAACDSIGIAALVDARCGYIFDPLTAAGFVLTLAFASLEGRTIEALVGGVVTGTALFTVWLATRGDALGLGDVKLAAVLGAGLGAGSGIVALGLAFVFGGAVGVLLLLCGKARGGTSIRFGPYLLAGILSVLSYHQLNTGAIPWP